MEATRKKKKPTNTFCLFMITPMSIFFYIFRCFYNENGSKPQILAINSMGSSTCEHLRLDSRRNKHWDEPQVSSIKYRASSISHIFIYTKCVSKYRLSFFALLFHASNYWCRSLSFHRAIVHNYYACNRESNRFVNTYGNIVHLIFFIVVVAEKNSPLSFVPSEIAPLSVMIATGDRCTSSISL